MTTKPKKKVIKKAPRKKKSAAVKQDAVMDRIDELCELIEQIRRESQKVCNCQCYRQYRWSNRDPLPLPWTQPDRIPLYPQPHPTTYPQVSHYRCGG